MAEETCDGKIVVIEDGVGTSPKEKKTSTTQGLYSGKIFYLAADDPSTRIK
jgi:hypothetical protein